jgi:hypothetical protein
VSNRKKAIALVFIAIMCVALIFGFFILNGTFSGTTSTMLSRSQNNNLWNYSFVATYSGSRNQVIGGTIHIDALLTYLGSQNVSINYVDPLLAGISVQSLANPSRSVWGFYPPAVTFFNYTVSRGMSLRDSVTIQADNPGFIRGQEYSIGFAPMVNYTSTRETDADLQIEWNFTLV